MKRKLSMGVAEEKYDKLHATAGALMTAAKAYIKSSFKLLHQDRPISSDLSGNFKKLILNRYKMWVWIFASSDFKTVEMYRTNLGYKKDMPTEDMDEYVKNVLRFCKSIAILYSVASQKIHCAAPILNPTSCNEEQIPSVVKESFPDPSVHQVVQLYGSPEGFLFIAFLFIFLNCLFDIGNKLITCVLEIGN